ncbi:MAG: hypothetical protein MUE74_06200, partial [Bacteroidales bacterium]|nr:hypothetical protein [Bacteroidales bacterium]
MKKEKASIRNIWPWWRWLMTVLNITALVLTAVMSWHHLAGGSMAGCGGGSPCEQVLSSRWSVVFGILPVSGLAMGVYLAMLAAGFYTGPSSELPVRRLAWGTMLILAGSVVGSAIWFTIVQKWIIRSFCPYCLSAHLTGVILSALVIWHSVKEYQGNSFRPMQVAGRVFAGLALAGVLVAFQSGTGTAPAYAEGESQTYVPAVEYRDFPLKGSPDAPYIVTLLFDYQCSFCQRIHFMLDEVILRYSGKVAFALCPAPLSNQCNPYIPMDADEFRNSCELARIGMAVWVADLEQFPVFENFMFTFESGDRWQPRSPEEAKAKAIELVGSDKFNEAISDPLVSRYIETAVQIYGQTLRNGKGGIPKLIYGPRWIIPEVYNADDLAAILQKSLE